MTELTPQNRLVRKRNFNLQKQLEVTLHLLNQEYRQAKERMYKDERDCGRFLQSLYSTVPGLQSYGQPDTRAMNTNAMLRERHFSILTGLDDDDDDDDRVSRHHRSQPHHHRRPSTSSGRDSPVKEGGGGVGGRRRPNTAGGGGDSRLPGADGVTGSTHKTPPKRPATATGAGSFHSSRKGSTGTAQYGMGACSEHERHTHEKVIDKFKFIFDPQTQARKFNLSTVATPIVVVNDTSSQRLGGGDGDGADCNNNNKKEGSGERLQNGHANSAAQGDRAAGRTGPGGRRVIWSAQSRTRKVGVVSAPNSARTERPSSENSRPTTTTIPFTTSTPRPHSSKPSGSRPLISKPRSSSFTNDKLVNGSGVASEAHAVSSSSFSSSFSSTSSPRPRTARLDPKIASLALQRELPLTNGWMVKANDIEDEDLTQGVPEDQQAGDVLVTANSRDSRSIQDSDVPHGLPNGDTDEIERTADTSPLSLTQTVANPAAPVNRPGTASAYRPLETVHEFTTSTESTSDERPKKSSVGQQRTVNNGPTSVLKSTANGAANLTKQHPQLQHRQPSSPNLLQVPGNSKTDTNGSGQASNGATTNGTGPHNNSRGWTMVRNLVKRPSSRLSEAESHDSGLSQPPTQLMARLMAAGTTPGSSSREANSKRPKALSPSKSQLSARSMPAPRQTVAGILAQIENQKANTRAMLDTSRQLQKVVKGLVPWEQPAKDDYDDDW